MYSIGFAYFWFVAMEKTVALFTFPHYRVLSFYPTKMAFLLNRNQNKKTNFILLETILCCGIISLVLLAASFPVNQMMNKIALVSDSRSIVQDIELVRALSQMQSEKLKMEFFGSLNRYRFEIKQGGMGKQGGCIERTFHHGIGFPNYFSISSVRYIDESGLSKTGSINFGSTSSEIYGTLVFDSSGTPSQGGHLVIMNSQTRTALSIIVKPVTGRVRVGKVHFIHP